MLNPNAQPRRSRLPDHPEIRENVTPERPPIYGIISVRGKVKVDTSQVTILCTWDKADYKFWQDGRLIAPVMARPFIETAAHELQEDIENCKRPAGLSDDEFNRQKDAGKAGIAERKKAPGLDRTTAKLGAARCGANARLHGVAPRSHVIPCAVRR